MQLKVGDKAPNFSLRNTEKKEVSLADYSGKNVVVLFFPLAFTGVCTEELCSVRDDMSSYENLDAEILAISVDSLFTLDRFKAEQEYNFELLSDFNKEVSRAYGSMYDDFVLEMKGVSKRSAFVINGEGTICYAEVLESAGDVPNFNQVKKTLESLK